MCVYSTTHKHTGHSVDINSHITRLLAVAIVSGVRGITVLSDRAHISLTPHSLWSARGGRSVNGMTFIARGEKDERDTCRHRYEGVL